MKRHLRSDFQVVSVERDAVTIRDLNYGRKSVTNNAEAVVKELRDAGILPVGRRLFYYDSVGDLDEITWDEKGNVGFASGPRKGQP